MVDLSKEYKRWVIYLCIQPPDACSGDGKKITVMIEADIDLLCEAMY